MEQPQPKPLTVTLLSSPTNPIGTLYLVWMQSRHNKPLPTPAEIERLLEFVKNEGWRTETLNEEIVEGLWGTSETLGYLKRPKYDIEDLRECAKHINDTVEMILNESIPVTENLNFTFRIQNLPISLREQLVRHKIGTHIDPKMGADITPIFGIEQYQFLKSLQDMYRTLPEGAYMQMDVLPDLAESTFWSQTSRIMNLGTFYDDGQWFLPPSLEGKTVQIRDGGASFTAEEVYRDALNCIQDNYNLLIKAGVHPEDARQILPLGMTHGITWTLNLKALQHIIGKRVCFIAQVGLWGDMIRQMVSQLRELSPLLGGIAKPPCVRGHEFINCTVPGTNKERIQGLDGPMPPCPLFVRYETQLALAAGRVWRESGNGEPQWTEPIVVPTEETHPLLQVSALYQECLDGGSRLYDVREWRTDNEVSREMLNTTAPLFSEIYGYDIFDPGTSLERK